MTDADAAADAVRAAWSAAAAEADTLVRGRPQLGHTADFSGEVGGHRVWDAHYQPVAPRDMFSMSKTVVAVLVGIAIDQGRLGLDDEVEPGATVRHLLTMTRGAVADFDDIDHLLEQSTSWLPTIRSTPRAHPPGTTFDYDNCGAHLLGVHLADRLGESLEQFATGTLFPALGVTQWTWPTDPDGYNFGFGHLQLLPDGLLAFARLLLHGGRGSDGRQVVSADWVDAMTTAHTAGGAPEDAGYGYLTWVDERGFFLGGWAGQHVTVLTRHRAIVVTTGLPSLLSADWQPARDTVVPVLVTAADRIDGSRGA